ncbi:MAG: CoA transferase [Alphaproteobacteria bacterium]|nr:CoA transferase [Alphaproteobacteria bacterium]
MLREIWDAVGGPVAALDRVRFAGAGSLPSSFAVTDLACAAIAAAGLAVSERIAAAGARPVALAVDRRLASSWFGTSIRPQGWSPPPPWDPIAGDYAAADGWIRLHTNAPHHRRAALAVLGVAAERADVARAVSAWSARALEDAVVAAGGCAAAMRSLADWAAHDQGRSVAGEPLVRLRTLEDGPAMHPQCDPARPLRGVRVLDLTRVLAGPVATRFLAGYGADVLRIDPPDWDEPALAPEMTIGKRPARLDLRDPAGRARLLDLLRDSDVLVHGYRCDALERLGLGADVRRRARPGLVDVALDAYGWTGPWRTRRGFDSLVQMSAGIAEAGMRRLGRDRPTPLPVQALDHATGYVMAAAAVLGLVERLRTGRGVEARTSLARTAALLAAYPQPPDAATIRPEDPDDLAPAIEETAWGPARRLRPPLSLPGASQSWNRAAAPLGSRVAAWD